jgi:hypothetical protein
MALERDYCPSCLLHLTWSLSPRNGRLSGSLVAWTRFAWSHPMMPPRAAAAGLDRPVSMSARRPSCYACRQPPGRSPGASQAGRPWYGRSQPWPCASPPGRVRRQDCATSPRRPPEFSRGSVLAPNDLARNDPERRINALYEVHPWSSLQGSARRGALTPCRPFP